MKSKLLHIASLADLKYLPMMTLPLLVPYFAGGPVEWWVVFGGIVAVALLNLTAVLVNTWSDRAGDQVSFPKGYAATDRYVGYNRLPLWIAAAYTSLVIATVTMGVTVSVSIAVIYTAGWIVATCYSVGPRLKRNLVFSRLCIACGPAFAFAGGWALRHSLIGLPAVVVLLFVAQGINTLLKDVPDAEGDREMGVRTLFTGLSRRRLATILPLLWTIPYVIAVVGVAAGWWPTRYLLLLLLYPFAIAVSRSPLVARTQREREMVREVAQMYATAWVLLNLLLFSHSGAVVLLCALGVAFYVTVLTAGVDRRKQGHGASDIAHFFGHTVTGVWQRRWAEPTIQEPMGAEHVGS